MFLFCMGEGSGWVIRVWGSSTVCEFVCGACIEGKWGYGLYRLGKGRAGSEKAVVRFGAVGRENFLRVVVCVSVSACLWACPLLGL